ncbi:MAG: hypothetical protein FLDDKLPJ_01403 [Phycisphaerae bacterium]|nr:hypothetical protein [Phycisphaerae bacterium]
MPRVFAWVAGCEVFLLAAALVLGLTATDPVGVRRHVGLALFTSLLACLIHAAVLTYTAVVGKLIHQAVALGALDHAPFEAARNIKRRLTSLIGAGMLPVAVVVGTGAWRLSGTAGQRWHLLAAGAACIMSAVVFYRQYELLAQAAEILADVMKTYERSRARPAIRPSAQGSKPAPGMAVAHPPGSPPDPLVAGEPQDVAG